MPADHQTAMFSATIPTQIQMMAAEVLADSIFVTVDQNGWNVPLTKEPQRHPIDIFVDELHVTWNVGSGFSCPDMLMQPKTQATIHILDHQTAMFSATFPQEIQMMAAEFLADSVYLSVKENGGWNVRKYHAFLHKFLLVTDVVEFEALPREPIIFPIEIFVDELHRTWNVVTDVFEFEDEDRVGFFLPGHADVAEDSGYDS
ncbi:hypothetical protein DFS34DRAFT_593285 [Phlyctochytrium arcticum]|nr:hypothetical protein DFS34DRAFT_593285 [Phlyctochytrium arcticum]